MEDAPKYLELESKVLDALKTVFDPEIPINIYELGLIYEIKIVENCFVNILMTLTAPNCPVAESLPVDVRNAILQIEGVKDAFVEITFDPPWDKDNLSEAALLELGLL
jgi:FeS assembly SUF system protein